MNFYRSPVVCLLLLSEPIQGPTGFVVRDLMCCFKQMRTKLNKFAGVLWRVGKLTFVGLLGGQMRLSE